jgi:hypothetical protein
MPNFSITYLAVIALAALGVENAESVVNAAVILVAAGVAFYGRYRAGGLRNIFGLK